MTDEQKYQEHMRHHGEKKVSWRPMLAVMESALAAAAKRIMALEKEVAELRASASLTDEAEEIEPALLKPNVELHRWN